MLKLRSEVIKLKKINTITKNINNFTNIKYTIIKFNILIVSNPLNNFYLIRKVNIL